VGPAGPTHPRFAWLIFRVAFRQASPGAATARSAPWASQTRIAPPARRFR
jgi:hypothetical protein